MRTNLILFIKGFIIGIAKIIPGVSGALLAISLNVYDKGINAITSFFDNYKENFKLLLFLGLGIITSILLFSKIINYTLSNYFVITMLFFIGLISGGLKSLIEKITFNKKGILVIIISCLLLIVISLFNIDNNISITNSFYDKIIFFISGLLEAMGTVIPGVSSTALLMIMGSYQLVIEYIANITNITFLVTNINLFIPLIMGLLMGLITLSIFINYMIKKFYNITFSFITGCTIASIILLFIKTFSKGFNIVELSLGLIMFIIGFFITKKLDD